MRSHDLPFVDPKMVMSEVVAVMTEGRLGLALVGAADDLRGIITDGDLRRTLVEGHRSFQPDSRTGDESDSADDFS